MKTKEKKENPTTHGLVSQVKYGVHSFDGGNRVFYFSENTGELLIEYIKNKSGNIQAIYKKENLINEFCVSDYETCSQMLTFITSKCSDAIGNKNIVKSGRTYGEKISVDAKFEKAKRLEGIFKDAREKASKEMLDRKITVMKNMELAKLKACNALAKKLSSLIPDEGEIPDADVNKVITLLGQLRIETGAPIPEEEARKTTSVKALLLEMGVM